MKNRPKSGKSRATTANTRNNGDNLELLEKAFPDPWSPPIQKAIYELIALIQRNGETFQNSDVVTEIIVTALKAVESQIGRGDLKLLSRSLRELRYAFKIFKSYRDVRKVTVFGSARTDKTDVSYKMARDFSKRLVDNGYMIITGAGPGIMEAGNEGAGPAGSFGVNIRLPYEQTPNRYIAHQPTYIDCRYFFTRKLVFVKEASGAAFFPGGFGTLDEAFEILTLIQTGKCDPIPVVLIESPNHVYWRDLGKFLKLKLLKAGKISKEDLSLFKITSSVDEAVKEIFGFYSNYHSLRYVDDQLVMRLQNPPDKSQLHFLNKHFKDILSEGEFRKSEALPEEANQPELAQLPRLVFKYNRVNNGRLRQLIDYLNKG